MTSLIVESSTNATKPNEVKGQKSKIRPSTIQKDHSCVYQQPNRLPNLVSMTARRNHQAFFVIWFLLAPATLAFLSRSITHQMSTLLAMTLEHRPANPSDIEACFAMEEASYPADEAATKESLTYRQANAGKYFQCTWLDGKLIGFVCSTRCNEFAHETMTTHDPNGRYLAIHSVVVEESYRRKGYATAMLQTYLQRLQEDQHSSVDGSDVTPIEKVVLLAKSHLLSFYVQCGFQVIRPSPIVHGQELWYDLEYNLIKDQPSSNEKWFVKTEQFSKPFPQVRPYLEEHRKWVASLRSRGVCITSGYRVDAEGKPGGGGLMMFAAASYDEARHLVLQDPLVANGCVDWQLNGWIGEVGNIKLT